MCELEKLGSVLTGKTVKKVCSVGSGGSLAKRRTEDRVGRTLDVQVGDSDFDGYGEVVIEFADGTYITVWSSEWGGIVYREA